MVVPVEDVVLKDEEDVKENREESKTKLGGVAEYTAPVIVVVGDQNHLGGNIEDETSEDETNLEDAEAAAGEVEEDVANAPANGALPSVVHEGLRHVPRQ